jgi:thiopurine S-methyltransferase
MKLDGDYWENRYTSGNTGWDIGAASTPIKNWLDKQEDKGLKILIPGAGNAHEVEYAYANGFTNVFVMDIAPTAIKNFKSRNPNFPESNILIGDFFDLEITFDVIIEQTFFCALNPKQRSKYKDKCYTVLKPNGILVGLLFDFPLTEEGPPFGGSEEEYITLFSPLFTIYKLDKCKDSINPRLGKELWVELRK